MGRLSNRVPAFLGGFAVVILAADVWHLLHLPLREEQQFSISTTSAALKFSDEERFPLFDPITGTWRINGNKVGSLLPFVQHWNEDPDGIGKFVVVRVGNPETIANARDTLLALMDQGICQVGLIDKGSSDETGMRQAFVVRIDWVRARDGTKRKCVST